LIRTFIFRCGNKDDTICFPFLRDALSPVSGVFIMRRFIFAASIAAAALVPSSALADTRSHNVCELKDSPRAAGSAQDKALAEVVDAVGAAIAGNQIAAKSGRTCDDAYGYYDTDNRWHASGVASNEARGYYDRDGNWIEGAPNGRYGDDGRWIVNLGSGQGEGAYSAQGEWVPASANGYYDRNDEWVHGSDSGYYDHRGRWIASVAPVQPDRRDNSYGYYDSQGQWHANAVSASGRASGYYDRNDTWVQGRPNGHYDERGNWIPQRDDGSASGSYDSQNRWIPASSAGYYDSDGRWVAGTASGYYDQRGLWVTGATVGRYDADGRWIAGAASGRRDANGTWIADPHPGYYDTSGQWHVGTAIGYYDGRGRWIATAPGATAPTLRPALLAQLSGLDQRIADARAQRLLTGREYMNLKREAGAIRSREDAMAHDSAGNVSGRNAVLLQARIDRLDTRLQTTVQ
jgi:hypothetical protein